MTDLQIVWWCEADRAEWEKLDGDDEYCAHDASRGCGFRRLADPDALVVEKVDGRWPEWALQAVRTGEIAPVVHSNAAAAVVLNVLAEASRKDRLNRPTN